jgi:hypothetical protein
MVSILALESSVAFRFAEAIFGGYNVVIDFNKYIFRDCVFARYSPGDIAL